MNKEKFVCHARAHGVKVVDDWTVEQLSDAIVAAGVPWPDDLINEEGWQLWTATIRHDTAVKSIKWDEAESKPDEIEITFRLGDGREYVSLIPRELLAREQFGTICRQLEGSLRVWKERDDLRLREALEKFDAEFQMRTPDLLNTLIGFRSWQLAGPKLKPIGAGNDVWRGGREVRAECGNGREHRAPAPDCECGLYAWYSWEKLAARAAAGTGQVFGAIAARGRVQLHNEGFRAEYMRPVLLGYDDTDDRITLDWDDGGAPCHQRSADFERVSAAAEILGGIEVVPFSVMEKAAQEFGQLPNKEWREQMVKSPDGRRTR